MLRITGGDWRGRKLRTPEGLDTRPTPSRVREALFSILGFGVRGAHFHDLFAGGGIVGLEALSRGAASCTFYESARPALAELRANIALLACADRAPVVTQRLPAGLPSAPSLQTPASSLQPTVFFLDPPYGQNLAVPTIDRLVELGWSRRAGDICVAQVEKLLDLPERFGDWGLRRRYPYGDTALWVYDSKEQK